jgi:hypothetical protein
MFLCVMYFRPFLGFLPLLIYTCSWLYIDFLSMAQRSFVAKLIGRIILHYLSLPSRSYRFHGSLSVEVSNGHPNMRIIRRKVALLLGQWISEVHSITILEKQNTCVNSFTWRSVDSPHRQLLIILTATLQIKGDTRKLVYHALVALLQDNDIAVRVSFVFTVHRGLFYFV